MVPCKCAFLGVMDYWDHEKQGKKEPQILSIEQNETSFARR